MSVLLFHITTRDAWTEAQKNGVYTAASLEVEGFIHLSKPSHVLEVADYLYRGRNDLILLCVNPDKLSTEMRYEALGTTEPYPHLYGPLDLKAVIKVLDFPPSADGTFQLPTDISSSVTP